MLQYILIFVFTFLCIFGPSIFPKSRSGPDDGKSVPWRPDPSVFIIMWTLIAFLVAIAWSLCVNNLKPPNVHVANFLFVGFLIAAGSWQFMYHNKKKSGITSFIILFCFLIPLIMFCYYTNQIYSAMMLCVPLVWCIFATKLNIAEVNNDAAVSAARRLSYSG